MQPGKAHAIRHAFADIDADVYVMVDGDDTYDAEIVMQMVDKLINSSTGHGRWQKIKCSDRRISIWSPNWKSIFQRLFQEDVSSGNFQDIFSGYRVFSRRFVKSFPIQSLGFEIETELSFHALSLRMQVTEIDTNYKERPVGLKSKLNTYVDGFSIVSTMIQLMRYNKLMLFYGCFAMFLEPFPFFLAYRSSGIFLKQVWCRSSRLSW